MFPQSWPTRSPASEDRSAIDFARSRAWPLLPAQNNAKTRSCSKARAVSSGGKSGAAPPRCGQYALVGRPELTAVQPGPFEVVAEGFIQLDEVGAVLLQP